MFVKITRINSRGEEKECLVNTDYIVGITEKHVEATNLYDEEGNIVETRTPEKLFEVVSSKDKVTLHTFVNETTYNELVNLLVK